MSGSWLDRREVYWQPPRCGHGFILLGCPNDDCPAQKAYLDQEEAAIRDYLDRQQQAARQLVRDMLGLPKEAPR